jgi:hypothetical protein
MNYYKLRPILGMNCKYNVVLSDRGRGKSFEAKHFLMRQSGTSMCLYRNSSDMHMAMLSWIEPLVSKLKDLTEYEVYDADAFEWRGNDKEGFTLYYYGSPKVWFRYLTQVNHIKQEVFPDDMNWVWLDEFIPLAYKKLPGIDSEGDAIRAIVKTIEHDSLASRTDRGLKPVRVILFANPFTWNNPILSYFHVLPKYGRYRAGPEIAVEMLEPVPEERKGKMTADDFLGNEVNRNQGWARQLSYVEEEWPVVNPRMSLRFDNDYFGIYVNARGDWYCKRNKEHLNCERFSATTCDPGELSLHRMLLQYISRLCVSGKITYKSINDKFDFQNDVFNTKI